MDIVAAAPSSGAPFHNHDVREWSRLDSITGVLERARLETDHWTANTATTSHKYNKVVDSRARSGADGNLQQAARRKLEVFHSQVPGGRIQVIKTQTVSSSRWSGQLTAAAAAAATTAAAAPAAVDAGSRETRNAFEDLKLPLNPLDLTSEKAKASVGRGVGRRPPSRARIRDDILARNLHATATTNLHRVSRLCHQIHNSAVRQTFGKRPAAATTETPAAAAAVDGVEIVDVTDDPPPSPPLSPSQPQRNHTNLTRTKSTSSEDFFEKRKSLEDLEDLEQLQTWRRTSKLRRSLQYPKQKEAQLTKPPDLPAAGCVRKIREDLETGRRLNTALRGNNVDLDALDQLLQSISTSSVSSDQSDVVIAARRQKRDSFVTVESIQAVRDKLRRTTSPSITIYEQEAPKPDEDDDGIVTDKPVNLQQLEDPTNNKNMNHRCYERSNNQHLEVNTNNKMNHRRYERSINTASKPALVNTGSLESRTKINNCKQDDWFARRKSYGFEQMQQSQSSGSDSLKNKNESSTDSGICRSTEIVPPAKVNANELDFNDVIKDDNVTNVKKYAMIFENKNDGKHAIKNARNTDGKRHSIAVDESKYMSSNREDQFKRTSLVVDTNPLINTKDDDNKRTKKVEFCKTEVHFAADSGRVNIVETDEKPPPTQRFRRRRRNSGPSVEDYGRGLPVQHFGDSTYEKFLFGESTDEASNGIYENLQNGHNGVNESSNTPSKAQIISANVTVNAVNGNCFEIDEEPLKDENEAQYPRGILKNKPVKPKPFLLGEAWNYGSMNEALKSTLKKDDCCSSQEFQHLRQHLRPTNRRLDYSSEETQEERYGPVVSKDRLLSPPVDDRCSSWSVADRIKQVEELKWTENKGYSTKVNFGDGEATVVENKHPTWPRKEDYKDLEQKSKNKTFPEANKSLNKSLVVRIGQQSDTAHKVSSKMINGSTTTTKITIDLSPSPTSDEVNGFKFPRAALQNFKSPSLIMNTIGRPKLSGLADIKQMYEDAQSDAEADKEVHRILMNSEESSVASGSWSKMRAFKQVHNYEKSHTNHALSNGTHNHSLLEKETSKNILNEKAYKYKLINDQIEEDLKYLNQEVKNLNLSNLNKISKSPLNNCNGKLSSPFLVGRSRSRTSSLSSDPEVSSMGNCDRKMESPRVVRDASPNRFGQSVLRQPKKSEMAYFGVPATEKKCVKNGKLTEKPDLLQFNTGNKKSSYISAAPTSGPIYENMTGNKASLRKSQDSSILEELTKAADEILLAVNGYTDEERRVSTDDELHTKKKLDTITENKSWKHTKTSSSTRTNHISRICDKHEKHKSSNSSIDSITRDVHKSFDQLDKRTKSTNIEKKELTRKKVTNDVVQKTATKARRLQRASSREALLHSHGSSSEDLPNHGELVMRKPRLVKRTKTTQLSVTASGLEMKKPSRKPHEVAHKSKHERSVESNLPEIRHKMAVTTIRSTAEKQAASRERAKLRSEESKKRLSTVKRDTNKELTKRRNQRHEATS